MTRNDILWNNYVTAYNTLQKASLELYTNAPLKLELIRLSLNNPLERAAALSVIEHMLPEDIKLLIYDLLELACYSHGLTQLTQKIILALPHDWLKENIEQHAERILERNDYEEYRAILHIYSEIDTQLMRKLAQRAVEHDDLDIREAGLDFLDTL